MRAPAGTEQYIAVERILNGDAERPSVSDRGLDLFAEVPEAQHHAIDALAPQEIELMEYEGPSGDREQRLGHPVGKGPEPGGETAGKYGNGQHSGEDDLCAFEVEAKAHLLQSRFRHGLAQQTAVGGVKHQEAAASGADQLAAHCTVTHCL